MYICTLSITSVSKTVVKRCVFSLNLNMSSSEFLVWEWVPFSWSSIRKCTFAKLCWQMWWDVVSSVELNRVQSGVQYPCRYSADLLADVHWRLAMIDSRDVHETFQTKTDEIWDAIGVGTGRQGVAAARPTKLLGEQVVHLGLTIFSVTYS